MGLLQVTGTAEKVSKGADLSERTKRGADKSEKQKLGIAGASLLGVL